MKLSELPIKFLSDENGLYCHRVTLNDLAKVLQFISLDLECFQGQELVRKEINAFLKEISES